MDEWLQLFRSTNPKVRIRAARGLLQHRETIPLSVLLEILDDLHDEGLGAETERVLRGRRDQELVPAMIRRLHSSSPFVREVACGVLGRFGDHTATPHLLASLDDPVMMVRRAAGFGLAFLADHESGTAILKRYHSRADDSNVIAALECALQALGIDFQRRQI